MLKTGSMSLHTVLMTDYSLTWKLEQQKQIVKHLSDLGNQHNNGPHQDQFFGNPYALCLALSAKNQILLCW